jgi:hypothetical protein
MLNLRRFMVWALCSIFVCSGVAQAALLFQDDFENTSFSSKGWYDIGGGTLSTTEHVAGSVRSLECRLLQGESTCSGGTPGRHLFTETDAVYVSYYVKYSANWEGSNRSYHPHEFHVLTNIDDRFIGPSRTHLTAYIEQNEGTPRLQITDALNIDASRAGQNLVNVTELRGVSGCNGDGDGHGDGDCWVCGSNRCNEKIWLASRSYFQNTPGAFYKNDWHHVEVYFKLNSISNGKGVPDGVMQYWYDGTLIINDSHVLLRTGQHPTMKFNQFIIAPYIGDGSPVDQTMWIDNLTVMTSRPDNRPSPPTNLQVK